MVDTALIVDKEGLARKLANKPKAFIIFELLQNALDENISFVRITAEMLPGRPVCHVRVEDDAPEGFTDLRSIYTMFRDSKKGPDPQKRGRFEIGEKLVIALANKLTVTTTKGTVIIEGNQRRSSKSKTEKGSVVDLEVKMTRPEFEEVQEHVHMLLVSDSGPKVIYNGKTISPRKRIGIVKTQLQTVYANEDGELKSTRRNTEVHVYPVEVGEKSHIYEMGIPIVEIEDKWHYDVQQRVPMNWERDNVPASFIKAIRTAVLNELSDQLEEDDAQKPWVQSSLDSVNQTAITKIIKKQFGDKAVSYDPSDPEGSKRAVSEGYTVIPGRTFTKDVWENIRNAGAVLPAGKVTPSAIAYSNSPDAEQERLIPKDQWTDGMKRIVALTERLGQALLNEHIQVRIINEPIHCHFSAVFCKGAITTSLGFNCGRLGKKWFEKSNTDEGVLSLIIHEFGHYYSSDHLESKYNDSLSDLGARMTKLALDEPGIFEY